jgi:hypothetical protein
LGERWTIDFERKKVEISIPGRPDVIGDFQPPSVDRGLPIRRATFDVAASQVTFTLPQGDQVTAEVATTAGDPAPAARPIVYLDQLHWITLARHLWNPAKVPDQDRASAEVLIDLAGRRKIILPLSSAHLTETVPTYGRHRRHLATTMLGLSGGWQMRNPVDVRSRELQAALARRRPEAHSVFTLDPGVLFARGPRLPSFPPHIPAKLQQLLVKLTAVSSIYSTMIADEKIVSAEGHERAGRWARSLHDLARYLREQRLPADDARALTQQRLFLDLAEELEIVARTGQFEIGSVNGWIEHAAADDLLRMPLLGRLNEILFLRLRNADDRWASNDFNDMHFLSCAAGYADVVVGEKKMSSYLVRAEQRVGRRAYVCRRLPDAADYLLGLGLDDDG